MKILWS